MEKEEKSLQIVIKVEIDIPKGGAIIRVHYLIQFKCWIFYSKLM